MFMSHIKFLGYILFLFIKRRAYY